jgi:Protein of unknown function (DUF3775)
MIIYFYTNQDDYPMQHHAAPEPRVIRAVGSATGLATPAPLGRATSAEPQRNPMLNHLTIDQIKQIADMSNECRALRDTILNKTYQTDVDEVPLPRGERNPSSFDSLEVVEAVDDSGKYQQLRSMIANLTDDARIELRTVMWIGRGDFSAGEWNKALTQADGSSNQTVIDTLAEKADLHDYLMKGLYNLNLL